MAALLPHLGAALVAACIGLTIVNRFTNVRIYLVTAFIAISTLALLPFREFPATHYVRVLTGDLSMLSFVWLTAGAIQTLLHGERIRSRQDRFTAITVIVISLFLYPSALGLSPLDTYSIGYSPIYLGPFIFLLFVIAVWLNYWIAASSTVLALTAYHYGFMESNNLWDYIVDPVILIYCLSILVAEYKQLLSSSRQENIEK